jgi:Flp pilus assembly pilin Flp
VARRVFDRVNKGSPAGAVVAPRRVFDPEEGVPPPSQSAFFLLQSGRREQYRSLLKQAWRGGRTTDDRHWTSNSNSERRKDGGTMRETVRTLQSWTTDESGGSLVEYVMLAALIAVVSVSAVSLLGKEVSKKLEAPRKALAR